MLVADRVLTCDPHAEQTKGFFDVPADNVFGSLSTTIFWKIWSWKNPNCCFPRYWRRCRHHKRYGYGLLLTTSPSCNAQVMAIIGDIADRDFGWMIWLIPAVRFGKAVSRSIKRTVQNVFFAMQLHAVFRCSSQNLVIVVTTRSLKWKAIGKVRSMLAVAYLAALATKNLFLDKL